MAYLDCDDRPNVIHMYPFAQDCYPDFVQCTPINEHITAGDNPFWVCTRCAENARLDRVTGEVSHLNGL